MPQGSILGHLIFNICINNIFHFVDEEGITNYADTTTSHTVEDGIDTLITNLQLDSHTLLMWFDNNFIK